MEQYKDEKAFLKAEGIYHKTDVNPSHKPVYLITDLLSRFKAYFIEQAKKGKQSAEDCLNQWDGLPLVGVDSEWYSRKAVLRAMEEYANQFIPVAPAAPEPTTSTKQP